MTSWELRDIPIDPRNLQVNRRIKGGHWVPTEVKSAMKQLDMLVTPWFNAGWVPTKTSLYSVTLSYTFPTMRSDLDGPVKRTLDAVFGAMRRETNSPFANDSRVVSLDITKIVGEPSLSIRLEVLDS